MSRLTAVVVASLLGVASANATDVLVDPGGEICPREAVTGWSSFGEEVGTVPGATSGIGCALAPVIDPGQPAWLAFDVASVPRHLIVRVTLDVSRMQIAANEEIDVLDVRAQTAEASPITVSIGGGPAVYYVRLGWRDGPLVKSQASTLSGPTAAISLWLDRGDAATSAGGFVRLLVDGKDAIDTGSAESAVSPLPEPGSSAPTRVRFGVIGIRNLAEEPTASAGVLFLRPLGVELAWSRQPGVPGAQ
jgi:hypothetical protein